jgi:hypothetical protein
MRNPFENASASLADMIYIIIAAPIVLGVAYLIFAGVLP